MHITVRDKEDEWMLHLNGSDSYEIISDGSTYTIIENAAIRICDCSSPAIAEEIVQALVQWKKDKEKKHHEMTIIDDPRLKLEQPNERGKSADNG